MAYDKVVDSAQLEADLTSVADKIREKADITDKLEFPEGYNSALDEIISVYEAPTQTKSVTITENGLYPIMPDKEYFAMDFVRLTVNCPSPDEALAEVESMLTNGYTNYSYMFFSKNLGEMPNETIRHIENGTNFTYFCYGNPLTELPVLNTKNGENFASSFGVNPNLVTMAGIDISNASNVSGMFSSCSALENITFDGVIKITGLVLSSCPKLTHDSLMSAINALYDWASEGSTRTYKLTLGSTNLAKLTDAEKDIANVKGWTLA